MIALRSLSIAMLKGFTRNRLGLFFTFLFPPMFLFVFGLLFRDPAVGKIKMMVVGDGPVITALDRTGAVDLQRMDNAADAVTRVHDGAAAVAVIEQGRQIEVRYAASDQAQAITAQGLVRGVVDQASLAATGQQAAFAYHAQQVEDVSLKPIQYLTPGLLSWSLASSAAFGAAVTLVSWRRSKLLRRIQLSPVRPATVLFARLGVAIGIALAQAVLFLAIAVTPLFGLRLTGQWWLCFVVLVMATMAFFAVGSFVGSFTTTEESAQAVSNVIIFPMMFLSGTFFPIERSPDWVQALSKVLPLRWTNDAMLDVLARGKGIESLVVPCAVLAGFTIVVGAVAARIFRWEDA